MTKVGRLYEEEKETAIKNYSREIVENLLKNNVDKLIILQSVSNISLDEIKKIEESLNN